MARVASDHLPIAILREPGGLSARIYRCDGMHGRYYTVDFIRLFKCNDKLHITRGFREEHLLLLAHLSIRCHSKINSLIDSDELGIN